MAASQVPDHPLEVVIDGQRLLMSPKRFKSGSVGWYLSTKLELSGSRSQLSFSAVVVGSKPTTTEIDMGGGVTLISDDEPHPFDAKPDARPGKGKRQRKGPSPA